MGKFTSLWCRATFATSLTWNCTNQLPFFNYRTTGKRQLVSTSLAELSFSCSVRRSVRQSVERYLLQIIMLVFLVVTGAYGKHSITKNRAMEARAKQLASDVFDRLANNAALSYQEPVAYPERGISSAQLRDDVLRSEFSSSRRKKLWDRVQKKVEGNSNVRAGVRTANSGDIARMWEWTGPLQLIEDGRSSGLRDSGRFSTAIASSPPTGSKVAREVKSWNEGRPAF